MKLVVDERVKHRIVGVLVIVSLGAIFVPTLMKKSNQRFNAHHTVAIQLPPKPALPEVSPPKPQVLFNQVKVAHVTIPAVQTNKAVTLKAQPLPQASTARASIATIKELSRTNEVSISPKLAAQTHREVAPALLKKTAKVTMERMKKVEVVNKTPVAAASRYSVQLAVFSRQSNAIALVKRLKGKGYNAFSNPIKNNKGTLYRVLVGNMDQRQQAQLLQQQLASAVQLKGFIVPTV